ncbi:MAG: amidophosphoribosyltransferase [Candidatus ainarchaeum sp.]|nr:amidophosphoribosyltransferase [Candidatus ainarchaeum sp.]MDD5096184.1 amidophosphoribosyltransferase [Candidatus ainarchaeum sp.]
MEKFDRQPDIWAGEQKRESCGIVAVVSKNSKPVANYVYNGMLALQHRGQDAAGMVIYDGKKLNEKKGLGLVSRIFSEKDIAMEGGIGIAHTRYPTTEGFGIEDVQPSVLQKIGLAVSHNGHIANYTELRGGFEKRGAKFEGTVDSEVIAHVLAEAFAAGKDIEGAVRHAMDKLDGSYSVVAIKDGVLFAFRDPHAIRPFELGESDCAYFAASETVAFDINGARHVGTLGGGEMAIISPTKGFQKKMVAPSDHRHCMFEYVYFSRPDSVINGVGVHEARRKLGEALAKEAPVKADVVVPIPDTARTAALAISMALGIPYEEGIIKNRYVARTFIMPDQNTRVAAVKAKLNPIRSVMEGKSVIVVDDSIVRGTTTREILKMIRDAGAKEIHMRVTCPPILHPCFYGVDMSTYEELIANKKSIEETRKFIGADTLYYVSLDGLKKAMGLGLCTGCLDGDYPTAYGAKLAKEKKGCGKEGKDSHGCGCG